MRYSRMKWAWPLMLGLVAVLLQAGVVQAAVQVLPDSALDNVTGAAACGICNPGGGGMCAGSPPPPGNCGGNPCTNMGNVCCVNIVSGPSLNDVCLNFWNPFFMCGIVAGGPCVTAQIDYCIPDPMIPGACICGNKQTVTYGIHNICN